MYVCISICAVCPMDFVVNFIGITVACLFSAGQHKPNVVFLTAIFLLCPVNCDLWLLMAKHPFQVLEVLPTDCEYNQSDNEGPDQTF